MLVAQALASLRGERNAHRSALGKLCGKVEQKKPRVVKEATLG
jgi:hypothetical protein